MILRLWWPACRLQIANLVEQLRLELLGSRR